MMVNHKKILSHIHPWFQSNLALDQRSRKMFSDMAQLHKRHHPRVLINQGHTTYSAREKTTTLPIRMKNVQISLNSSHIIVDISSRGSTHTIHILVLKINFSQKLNMNPSISSNRQPESRIIVIHSTRRLIQDFRKMNKAH